MAMRTATTRRGGWNMALAGLCAIALALGSMPFTPPASAVGHAVMLADGAGDPRHLTPVDGRVFFSADDGVHGRELWISDGTPEGTAMVKDIRPGSGGSITLFATTSSTFAELGGIFYFVATDGAFNKLWRSDGTEGGTHPVSDVGVPLPAHLVRVGDLLYFGAADATNGRELWRTDGTAEGTVLVQDIWPGSLSSTPMGLSRVGDSVFFNARDGNVAPANGQEPWTSVGTEVGASLVKDIFVGVDSSQPIGITDVDGVAYFSATDGGSGVGSGRELWKSDGTDAGTVLLKDIVPGGVGSSPIQLTDVNGTLYFTTVSAAGAEVGGNELWRSNGTPEGTLPVKDINLGSSSSDPRNLTNAGGSLFFAANDGVHAGELWWSDGSEAGTLLVKDIHPTGNGFTGSHSITPFGDTVLFSADDGANGTELWSSDGSADGTTLVADINPGPTGSFPRWLTIVGDTLFFSADDGAHGRVLWKVVVDAPPDPDDEGPLASAVELAPNPAGVGSDVAMSALVDDGSTGASTITAAEYQVDGGAFAPMEAADGTFDGVTEAVTGTIPAASLPHADVYDVCVRGTDAVGNTGAVSCASLAVYDPAAGSASGAGWIDSPPGAYAADPGAAGRARFGFVSRYKKGASVPDGQARFVFRAGDLKFESTEYEYLVVNQAGSRAQFKGTGSVNGVSGHGFIIWAAEADIDTFRIKIWDETEVTVYDNGTDQPISGGKISIKAN